MKRFVPAAEINVSAAKLKKACSCGVNQVLVGRWCPVRRILRHASCGLSAWIRCHRRNAVNRLIATLGWLVIPRCYVFPPMASRYRCKRVVHCPDFDEPAEILVDRSPGSTLKPKKKPLSIRNCSLWPKGKGCTQSCANSGPFLLS